MSAYHIRRAHRDELPSLQRIEDEAGRLFANAGIRSDLPGMPLHELEAALDDELLWVIAGSDDSAVGFALCWPRPDALHLRELDVHPDHGRRGLGGRLIERVTQEAQHRGLPQLTLTTFADVSWNAPYYERHGFVRWDDSELPQWLAQIRRSEAAAGLDRWPRLAMKRELMPTRL